MATVSFSIVSQNLRDIGAVSVDEYLASLSEISVKLKNVQVIQQPLGTLGVDAVEQEPEKSGQFENVLQIEAKLKDVQAIQQPLETITVDAIEQEPVESNQEENVLKIQRACRERCLSPSWIVYSSLETESEVIQWGAALRIDLFPPRFFATEQIHAGENEAKSVCAQLAIAEGILKVIHTASFPSGASIPKAVGPMSLHQWFAELPRPLPPFFDNKVLEGIHAAFTLDTWAMKARGARFKMHYYFPTIGNGPQRLFGCVLLIHRPSECRSFFVDPIFPRRVNAKTAVCLLAISQGVEDYYLSVANDIANIIKPEVRAFVNTRILPLLYPTAHGDTRIFAYPMDRNAYGCTLTVRKGTEETVYSVEPEYGSKADAKVAVLVTAANEDGFIELVTHGRVPPDYRMQLEAIKSQVSAMPIAGAKSLKRKRDEDPDLPQIMSGAKKRRKRKQTLVAGLKQDEAAAPSISNAVADPERPAGSSLPCSTPSEKALGNRRAIPSPQATPSGGPFEPPPFAPVLHF